MQAVRLVLEAYRLLANASSFCWAVGPRNPSLHAPPGCMNGHHCRLGLVSSRFAVAKSQFEGIAICAPSASLADGSAPWTEACTAVYGLWPF